MDRAVDDYSYAYSDTYIAHDPDGAAGICLLESPRDYSRPRAIRQRRDPNPETGRDPDPQHRDPFYGNVVSSRDRLPSVYNVGWEEVPMHFGTAAGPRQARLVPRADYRPYGGGPAPSLAYPMITHSEAVIAPRDRFSAMTSESHLLRVLEFIMVLLITIMMATTFFAGRCTHAPMAAKLAAAQPA